jgi:hypothetical protein
MSIIDPTKNTGIIVDDFITYAQSHLTTISGIVNVTAIYPPGPPPAPGAVQWQGYNVAGARRSEQLGTAEDQDTPEGDDPPIVEKKEADEHAERNDMVHMPDETLMPENEQSDFTPQTNFEFPREENLSVMAEDPGDFPKPKFKPKKFIVVQTNQHSDGNIGAGNLGPPPKIYGKVGAQAMPGAPDFREKYKNAFIPHEAMVGVAKGSRDKYKYNGTGGWYLLHPEAASQYFKMKDQAIKEKISWTVTSAYRDFEHQKSLGSGSTVAKAGSSPHGWGMALDFSELYAQVNGSGNPAINKAGREKSSLYRWLSNNGPKYGWYNPYRLADGGGVDEMWHWEYWGHYVTYTGNDDVPGDNVFITYNIDKDLPAMIVWGGIDYATPNWMATQIPQTLKNSKKIVIAPYTVPLETIQNKYKGIKIGSVSGFSAGGQQAWRHAGTVPFTGLIDPSTTAEHVAKAKVWGNVVMLYNNNNWGGKYAGVGDRQVEAAVKMVGSALKKEIAHSAMPAEFFRLYGHKL